MRADEIRSRFLDYFARQGHTVRPSFSLGPQDYPTLLFTNAGMVPFKKVFLGMENTGFSRAPPRRSPCAPGASTTTWNRWG
ncbi:MAG TPA: alanine--tRNA ligase-related protein [Longimicrobiaceae bacterium]|nr:alanine--tRNA ligase-related protein [Longimicrobiaceae bacterium]